MLQTWWGFDTRWQSNRLAIPCQLEASWNLGPNSAVRACHHTKQAYFGILFKLLRHPLAAFGGGLNARGLSTPRA